MTRKTIRMIEIGLGAVLVLFIIVLVVFVKPQNRQVTPNSSVVSSMVSSSEASSESTSSESISSAASVSSASSVAASSEEETVSVTIPEGYSLQKICQRLADKGVGSYDTLLKTATTYNFSSYSCIANASKTNRCYTLEGYLFPATYEFYKGEAPADVFGKMLHAFDSNTAAYKSKAIASCGSLDKAIILASVIEKEAGNPNYVANVSSVFHNRLSVGMKLQADSTISYLNSLGTALCDKYKYYYNTERFVGLPAGPICNPGLRALNAAVNPASTKYMYFCTDNQDPPQYYFAVTLDEHKANLKKCGYQ
ncbi:MAG TPA: endolytic transglycosylase MltG [Oscillospiraceae bacterium]|nr:endolytic transglycosylase MltG [Oscillospiraceae bacterium]